ncbi:hypothetical protein F3E67_18740 [Salmonella enterica subsp. salamae]|nr:hypothetical protein [Salmonella enterica subsp. salamae]
MHNPYTMRILVWFVMSSVICLCVWLLRRKGLNADYATLAIARENFIKEGANAANPREPVLPDNPSDALTEAYYTYKHWQEQARKTGSTGLHIMLHTPGVMAIIVLFAC